MFRFSSLLPEGSGSAGRGHSRRSGRSSGGSQAITFAGPETLPGKQAAHSFDQLSIHRSLKLASYPWTSCPNSEPVPLQCDSRPRSYMYPWTRTLLRPLQSFATPQGRNEPKPKASPPSTKPHINPYTLYYVIMCIEREREREREIYIYIYNTANTYNATESRSLVRSCSGAASATAASSAAARSARELRKGSPAGSGCHTCVYIYIYIYICLYVCMYIYIHTYAHTYIDTRTERLHICIHVYISTHPLSTSLLCVCTYIYIYIYI